MKRKKNPRTSSPFLSFSRIFLSFHGGSREKKGKCEKNVKAVKKSSDISFFSPKNASFSVKRKKNARPGMQSPEKNYIKNTI